MATGVVIDFLVVADQDLSVYALIGCNGARFYLVRGGDVLIGGLRRRVLTTSFRAVTKRDGGAIC